MLAIFSHEKEYHVSTGASLVDQWLRIHLPMQETYVGSLVWEDHTCPGATDHVCRNYWTHAHHNEKLTHHKRAAIMKSTCSNEDPTQPKGNKQILKNIKKTLQNFKMHVCAHTHLQTKNISDVLYVNSLFLILELASEIEKSLT